MMLKAASIALVLLASSTARALTPTALYRIARIGTHESVSALLKHSDHGRSIRRPHCPSRFQESKLDLAATFLPDYNDVAVTIGTGLMAQQEVAAPSNPDPDLIVGYLMIVAASTPYVLSLFFPDFFLKTFFLPVYKDDKEGRDAEIEWKTRYATLGLVLTTLVGLELWLAPVRAMNSFTVLRDAYICWSIFYTDAFLKIRKEAQEGIIGENIVGIQLWHFLVVLVLWADVSRSPLAKSLLNGIIELFS